MPRPKIDHIVVLLLENRSFDHMFGFLDHPDPNFPRLTDQFIGQTKVSHDARYQVDSPDHSHNGVMAQLFGGESFKKDWTWNDDNNYPSTGNKGFVESYRHNCGGDAAKAARIMRCFHPEAIPVMATLAKQFALFTNWYCSVPGETWPNRDFAVAAQSFGEVNQKYWVRPKRSTVFEQLAAALPAGPIAPYRIYHDSIAHTFLYPGLYGRGAFHGMKRFFEDVANETLPRFSYIEPDYGLGSNKWYMDLTAKALGNKAPGDAYGNSQHPGQAHSTAEFVAGEHLIAGIYNALLETMNKHAGSEENSLFARTLFLITYDEHGGFYDRMLPPRAVPPKPNQISKEGFKFDLLGPRVPAILISPWIRPGTLIETVFDHSAIPATVRNVFAPTVGPLTDRDANASRFHLIGVSQDSTLRTPMTANPVQPVEALDFEAAVAVMHEHGAKASAADDHYAPTATLRQDWTYVAKTANKLLPPLPLGVAAIDAETKPDDFAVDVVARMHAQPEPAVAPPPPKGAAPAKPPPKHDLPPPTTRSLRVYAFDPGMGRTDSVMTLDVPYQPLAPGPVETAGYLKSRLAVVDYDASTKTYYKHVDLDHPSVMLANGLAPSESDTRFHQQMVYAVARDTVAHFEAALGRRIHWRRAQREPGDPRGWMPEDILTLGLHPHAMQAPNAFYSPAAHAILFGYFKADAKSARGLPGQPVFTCLSHDIIVHELTHAILDGQRAHFLEQTNLDVAAFHEAFADLAALFRHFTHEEALLHTMQRTGGKIYSTQLRAEAAADRGKVMFGAQMTPDNPLVGLAHQFGDAIGNRRALRAALGTPPTPSAYRSVTEPHKRGSILVAAVFDAFFTIYTKRTADLWAIFRAGGGGNEPIDLPRPLADQLCRAAASTATEFFQICVRAIDYCPPVDLTFGDFLRAMITSEVDRNPGDPDGIREALMQAFRSRGILPDGARFFSEDSLCWSRGDDCLPRLAGLSFDPTELTSREKDATAVVLNEYFARDRVRDVLNLEIGADVIVKSFHPIFRTVDGRLEHDLVVEVVQTRQVAFDDDPNSRYPYRAGTTMIVSSRGKVRWFAGKPMFADGVPAREEAKDRHIRQQDFLTGQGIAGEIDEHHLRVDFAGIHGGV